MKREAALDILRKAARALCSNRRPAIRFGGAWGGRRPIRHRHRGSIRKRSNRRHAPLRRLRALVFPVRGERGCSRVAGPRSRTERRDRARGGDCLLTIRAVEACAAISRLDGEDRRASQRPPSNPSSRALAASRSWRAASSPARWPSGGAGALGGSAMAAMPDSPARLRIPCSRWSFWTPLMV